jgi:5-hydroxyisourate hydrolase
MSQITTHILDTSLGLPAAGVGVSLDYFEEGLWQRLVTGVTNVDGRIPDFLPEDKTLPAGTYRLVFDTAAYLQQRQQPVFYPSVDVTFNLDAGGAHYHIPLLLSPFGYSTYRGS